MFNIYLLGVFLDVSKEHLWKCLNYGTQNKDAFFCFPACHKWMKGTGEEFV